MMFGIFCYDNSNALSDKCEEILRLNVRQESEGMNVKEHVRNGMIESSLLLQQLLGQGRRLGMKMSRAVGIECFLWVFRVAILVMVWSKKGRACLEEHAYTQIAMSVAIYLLMGNRHAVSDKCKHFKTGMSRGITAIAVRIKHASDECRVRGTQAVNAVLFGNFCAYVCGYSAVTIVGSVASDSLRDLFEWLVALKCSESNHEPRTLPESQKEDCDTVTTTAETTDVSWTESPDEERSNSDNGWCVIVKGTQYIVHARQGGNSSFGMEKKCREHLAIHNETMKERNRRLLLQHRESRMSSKKPKRSKQAGKHLKCEKELQGIKEEDMTLDAEQRAFGGDRGALESELQQERDDVIGDGRRRAELVLREKFKGLTGRTWRGRRSHRRKIKVKRPSVRQTTPGFWRPAAREFSYIVKLYSCSAVRYARFRSNRRFKPGD